MRTARSAGTFLWHLRADGIYRRTDCTHGRNTSSLLSEAFELARLYSSTAHEKSFYPVKICQGAHPYDGEYGKFVPGDLPGQEDRENTDVSSERKRGDRSCNWSYIAVSAYEDVVGVACGNHVYVSSLMSLGQNLRERLNDTKLADYVKFAVEDEKSEHILALTEVSGVPTQIRFPEAVVSVACGAEHLLLCTSVGRVYSMGSNRQGQLGRGSQNSDFERLSVVSLAGDYSSSSGELCSPAAVAVYAGFNFSFVIARRRGTSTEKTALCAKQSAPTSSPTADLTYVFQKEGVKTSSEFHSPLIEHAAPCVASTALLSPAEKSRVTNELCSFADGEGEILYSWGCNDYGQLGHGTKETAFKPLEVTRPREVSSWSGVAAGFAHAVIVTGSHTVYSCGLNLYGQLGLGTTKEETSLHKINLPELVQQVSCGTWHTLFLTSSGQLLAAGRPPEFPYTSWLQSGSSKTNLINVHRNRVGIGLECSADNKSFSAGACTTLQRSASSPDDRSQAQTPAPNLQAKLEQPTQVTAMVTSPHHILLSTTRHLLRLRADADDALAQPRSSVTPEFSGTNSVGHVPFAHAPGILRVKGFREDLKFISAGPTTSAAIGLSEHEKRCRLYVWKAAELREYPENWFFVSEVYDISSILKLVGDVKGANVACHCAPSGVYLWTETSPLRSSNQQL